MQRHTAAPAWRALRVCWQQGLRVSLEGVEGVVVHQEAPDIGHSPRIPALREQTEGHGFASGGAGDVTKPQAQAGGGCSAARGCRPPSATAYGLLVAYGMPHASKSAMMRVRKGARAFHHRQVPRYRSRCCWLRVQDRERARPVQPRGSSPASVMPPGLADSTPARSA